MTVPTISVLTNNADHASDTTSYNTASISPAANSMILGFFCSAIGGGTPPTITPTGLSLSWTPLLDTGVGSTRRIVLSRAICGASPGSGVVNIAHDVASTGTEWALLQVIDYLAANPTPQFNSALASSGTTATVTLPGAAVNADSRTVAAAHHRLNAATTAGAGFTALCNNTGSAPVMSYITERSTSAFLATATATWASTANWMIVAVEIAGDSGVAPPADKLYVPMLRKSHLGQSAGRT